jgi:hypothetical protein
MSGGYIDNQPKLGHQVVIFTFKGDISSALVGEWNRAILDLKRRFGERITGVTIRGETTKPRHLKTAGRRRRRAR